MNAEPTPTTPEVEPPEQASRCDCCDQLKYGCTDVVAYGLDTHACPQCRGLDEDGE
jgi:hypothetical protein